MRRPITSSTSAPVAAEGGRIVATGTPAEVAKGRRESDGAGAGEYLAA